MTQTLQEVVQRFHGEAEQVVSDPDYAAAVDPDAQLAKSEALDAQLKEVREQDNTPVVLQVADTANVLWERVLDVLREDLRRFSLEPGARRVLGTVDPERSVAPAMEQAETARKLVGEVIDGTKVNKRKVAELREKVLGDRPVPRTRAAMESELKSLRTAISGLGQQAPAALAALLPSLDLAVERLDAARSGAGRPRTQTVVWSRDVQVASAALDLAMSECFSWALATATSKRQAAFRRVVLPRRRPESQPADAAAPAETPPPALLSPALVGADGASGE